MTDLTPPDGSGRVYVARRASDNSVRAYCYDDPGEEADTARTLADWRRRGLLITRQDGPPMRERHPLDAAGDP